jgi:hypothetical protein
MTVNTQRLIESLTALMNKIKLWFEPKNYHPIGACDSTPNFPNILDISDSDLTVRATRVEIL